VHLQLGLYNGPGRWLNMQNGAQAEWGFADGKCSAHEIISATAKTKEQ